MTDKFTRKPAIRLASALLNKTTFNFKKSEDQFDPKLWITPNGIELNRILIMGTLTDKEDIGQESENWRLRVVDPTGTAFIYAGQYQPDARTVAAEIEEPCYVAVVGKPRDYTPEDGTTLISITPEEIYEVDQPTYLQWIVETAQHWIDSLPAMNTEPLSPNASKAIEIYGEYDLSVASNNIQKLLDFADGLLGNPVPERESAPADSPAAETPVNTETDLNKPADEDIKTPPPEDKKDTPPPTEPKKETTPTADPTAKPAAESTTEQTPKPTPEPETKPKAKPKAKRVSKEIKGFVNDITSIWESPQNLTMNQLMEELPKVNESYNATKIGGLVTRVQELGLAYMPSSSTLTFVLE